MTTVARRVLVTGAAGFLGTHLCRRLLRDGFAGRLVGLDADPTWAALDRGDLGSGVTRVGADVREPATIERCLAGVEVVFHLAGIAHPRACESDPTKARAVNVDGTAAVVRAALGRRLVFLSSASVYRPGLATPLDEDAPVGDEGIYGATKLAGERLCLDAMRSGDLEAVVIRNFNTFGEGQAEEFLVPQIVAQALRGRSVEIASCRPVRDFTYVDDAIAAIASLGTRSRASGVFNLGSGRGVAVGDVALTVGRLLDVPVSCANVAVIGQQQLVATNAKLRSTIAWAPTIDLETGIARTIDWFRRQRAR